MSFFLGGAGGAYVMLYTYIYISYIYAPWNGFTKIDSTRNLAVVKNQGHTHLFSAISKGSGSVTPRIGGFGVNWL